MNDEYFGVSSTVFDDLAENWDVRILGPHDIALEFVDRTQELSLEVN